MKLWLIIAVLGMNVCADTLTLLEQKKLDDGSAEALLRTERFDINTTTVLQNAAEQNATIETPPSPKITTAALFLIDTSVPMRDAVDRGVTPMLTRLFEARNVYDHWAIAGFDADLRLVGDFNATDANASLAAMAIAGQRTELFRVSIEAVKLLESREAAAKYLVICSDGEFEDNAYSYDDVIAAAKAAGVTILSLGYRDSIHLQSIRRLAEETGGRLWIADRATHQFGEAFEATFLGYFHHLIHIELGAALLQPDPSGVRTFETVVTYDDNRSETVPLRFAVAKPTPEAQPQPPQKQETGILPYVAAAVLLLIVTLLVALRPKKRPVVDQSVAPQPPLAWLVTSSGTRLAMLKPHTTIGALADNDIVIDGDLVSRHHAILDFEDGRFHLIDRNSTNGVFVNARKITQAQLEDADILAFGPFEVTFTINKDAS